MSTEKESSRSGIKDSETGKTIPDNADFDMSNKAKRKAEGVVSKAINSWEQAWLENTDSKMIVKCANCLEPIGEIEIAYDYFKINCKECAVQGFTDAATSGDAE